MFIVIMHQEPPVVDPKKKEPNYSPKLRPGAHENNVIM